MTVVTFSLLAGDEKLLMLQPANMFRNIARLVCLLSLPGLLVSGMKAADRLLEPAPAVPTAELAKGDHLPDVRLTRQDGTPLSLTDYQGKAVAITFIYSGCPSPEFCPLVRRNFDAAQQLLRRLGTGETCQLLSITLDPVHDTPAVLAAWAKNAQADPKLWTFARGSEVEVDRLGRKIGLQVKRTDARIDHNLRTVVLDRAGRVYRVFRGDAWTPQELVVELKAAARAAN